MNVNTNEVPPLDLDKLKRTLDQMSTTVIRRGGQVIPEVQKQVDISATLAERGGRYGQFIDHAKIAQGIQDVLRTAPNWDKLDVDMKQALSVIADKMARILNGDPYYEDNWHDIQGYSKLVEDRINKEREA